jgi:cytochrome bd-type quinol oxidase subunit 2
MATYDPPQPLWKRNLAGVLDFLLVAIGFAVLLSMLFPSPARPPVTLPNGATAHEIFGLGTWPTLLLVVLIIAYFVVLGRTGGTVFQRIFRMRRAR